MNDFISITGQGIVCAIGNDAAQVLSSLRGKRSGIGPMKYLRSKHVDIPVGEVQLSNDLMKEMLGVDRDAVYSRTSLMGAIAVRQALDQAGIADTAGKRIALISGTTVGNMDITISNDNECGASTRDIAALCSLEDAKTCTISTACSSALNSIILGCEMLRSDEADIVIAGGSEALSSFHFNGFNSLMILDHEQCRPFDSSRNGLNLGEGAAFVVLQKNVPDALAYVSGYGNRCDAFHQTASSENGDGAFLAMSGALTMAGLSPSDIQYVNAHGTGTQSNDISESRALKRVFGSNMPQVSSTKPFTGHTTSASGSIETVICILAMREGFTPANLGWKTPDADGITPTMGQEKAILHNVMCNSFGFGGNDSSLILSDRPVMLQDVEPVFGTKVAAMQKIGPDDDMSELKAFIPAMELRRMGPLMRASILTALLSLKKAGLERPDAIVTATADGMLEVSRQFQKDIVENDEELLKPTLFMQSTHNTIGSAIAIRTLCHGYNITYSHGDESEYWAMEDATRMIRSGKASSVLVTVFDEAGPSAFQAKSTVIVRK